MAVFEPLVTEHNHIVEALVVLDALADRLDTSAHGELDLNTAKADLATLLRFFQRYADDCHHAKEEQILFPALAAAGMPVQDGPIAVMLAEHEEGRAFVRRLVQAAEQLGDEGSRADARAAGRGFSMLLRNHIDKENGVLYPMGRRFLDSSNDAQILQQYARHETQVISAQEKQELLEQLARLREEYVLDPSD